MIESHKPREGIKTQPSLYHVVEKEEILSAFSFAVAVRQI